MADQKDETLAVFLVDSNAAAQRLLKKIQKIDDTDKNVQIVDAAIADRTKRGRVKVHQTKDLGGVRGAGRGAAIGVVVGAIVLGPAGAVVGAAAGGVLNGVRNRMHDIGIDDKFMRGVSREIEKGKSALFVQYEGEWSKSIGLVKEALISEHALLMHSTLPAATAAKLRALVEPAAEQLGGEEVLGDYEVKVAPAAPAAAAPAPAAAAPAPAAAAAPAAKAAAPAGADDLTQLVGVGPKAAKALAASGMTTFAAVAKANEPDLRDALHRADMQAPASVGTWPMQANLAAKGDWQGLMRYNQKASEGKAQTAKPKAQAAKAPAAPTAPPDDLTKLNGIGPRISSILAEGGVTTYDQLEHTSSEKLRTIIAAGGALPPSSLGTWPRQAAMAAKGDWQGLATYNSRS